MTADSSDRTVRPITGRDELALFTRLPYVFNDELAGDLADGRRQPEWMWVALRGDRPGLRGGAYVNFERAVHMTWS